MIISKIALAKIRKVIENHYRALLVKLVGSKVLQGKDLKQLVDSGVAATNTSSLLGLLYNHNILNDLDSTTAPTAIEDMRRQQGSTPQVALHDAAVEHIDENLAQLVGKAKAGVQAGIEGIIRDYNMAFRNDSLLHEDRVKEVSALIMQSNVGGLKNRLRDYFKDSTRDWKRVAVTETANAIGLGAIDRVVSMNKGKDLSEIYVYRIPVNDGKLCIFCRKFYLDDDDTPAVYRLSTLLSNGSNYGKKPDDWLPVALATHPHDRETGVLELRRGWKLTAGGKLEFVGNDSWQEYIDEKLRD